MKKSFIYSILFSLCLFSVASTVSATTITLGTGGPTTNDAFGVDSTCGVYDKTAQSFVATDTQVDSATISLIAVGSPVDHVKVSVQADSSGHPSGTVLGSSVNVDPTSSYSSVTATFPGGVAVTNGATYWIVFERTGSLGTTGACTNGRYRVGDGGATYASGVRKERDATALTWADNFAEDSKGSISLSTAGGGGGGTSEPYPTGAAVFGTTTAFSLVDNPVADLFDGVVLLLGGFFGTVWFFRRPRT